MFICINIKLAERRTAREREEEDIELAVCYLAQALEQKIYKDCWDDYTNT